MAPGCQRRVLQTRRLAGVYAVRLTDRRGAATRIDLGTAMGQNQAMGKSILIVDDHPSFRASARRMLELTRKVCDADGMLDMLNQGLAAEGHTVRQFKFFDSLSFLDGFDAREWLVWNWGEEWAGLPWSDAEVGLMGNGPCFGSCVSSWVGSCIGSWVGS